MMSRPSAQFEPTTPVTSLALIDISNHPQQGPFEAKPMEEFSHHQPLKSKVDEKPRVFAAFDSSVSSKLNQYCSHHSPHTHRRQMSISSLMNSQTLSTRTILKIFIVTFLATYLSGLLPPPRLPFFIFHKTLSSLHADPNPLPSFQGLVDPTDTSLPLDFYSRTHSREWFETEDQITEHADDHLIEEDMLIEDRPESSRKPFKFPLRDSDSQVPVPSAEAAMSVPMDQELESNTPVIEVEGEADDDEGEEDEDEDAEEDEEVEDEDEEEKKSTQAAKIGALSHEFDILL